jgi:hypothetical protein
MADTDPRLLDRVAEAICATTSAGQLFPWAELSEHNRRPWRAMAQAAIDVMPSASRETSTR